MNNDLHYTDHLISIQPIEQDDLNKVVEILDYYFYWYGIFTKEEIIRIKNFPKENCWSIRDVNSKYPIGVIWMSQFNSGINNYCSISIAIEASYTTNNILHTKGKGIGKKSIKLITEYWFTHGKGNRIFALIHKSNEPSINAFISCEFSQIDSFEGVPETMVVFEKRKED